MARPLVYVCFGMPKSGSTLACNLTRVVARRAGYEQTPPLDPASGQRFESFVGDFATYEFDALIRTMARERRTHLVLKTHADPGPAVVAAIRGGLAQAQATCRDPRDIALSMRDAGQREEAWGRLSGGRHVEDPEEVRRRIRRHIARFRRWAALPGTLCLHYERTAFDTAWTARRIAEHLEVPARPNRDAFMAKRGAGQFNIGRSRRHEREMSEAQISEWYQAFRPFIDEYCSDRPRSTWSARLTTRLARLLAGRG